MTKPGRESHLYGGFPDQAHDAGLVRRQHAVFSLLQLRALGLSARAVHARTERGLLYRVHHGVYALVPPELLTTRGRFMAAVLACGDGAVLSHRSAAHLHDLRPTQRAGIDVTVPRRSSQSHENVDVHRSTTLTEADVTIVDGIPCTTIARTYLDLGDVVSTREVERALERGEMLQIADARGLDDQLARNPTRRAARRLRAALQNLRPGNAPTESQFEEDFLALCRRAGLPEPERQVYIDPGDGDPLVRADFIWRQQRLIVETDGRLAHRTRRAFESDRRRDQRLTLAGWRVVRVTWRQLVDEPWSVVDLLVRLLGLNEGSDRR